MLADPAASADARAEALRFLIHFMGDLHQPLHVGDNNDRGGNQRVVYLEGDSTNLHAVWDGKILERAGVTEAVYLAQLRRAMDTLDLAALERGSRGGLGNGGAPDLRRSASIASRRTAGSARRTSRATGRSSIARSSRQAFVWPSC